MNPYEFYQLLKINDGLLVGHTFDKYVSIDFKDFAPFGYNYLEFSKCVFKDGLSIKNFDDTTIEMLIKDTLITNLMVVQSNFRQINVEQCEIKKIELSKLEVVDSVLIECEKNDSITLEQIKTDTVVIRNKSEFGCLQLDTLETDFILLENQTIKKKLEIRNVKQLSCSGNFENVQIISNNFESIDLSYVYEDGNEIKTYITDLHVISDNIKGALLFNGVEIQNLKFTSVLSQSGVVQINNAEIENTSFLDSTFKNIYWNNVSFKQKLEIENSDLSALKYANIDWIPITKFSCIELQYDQLLYSEEEKKEVIDNIKDLRNEREVYRQLKSAATSMQNHIDAMEFYRLEMRLYWKDIRFTKSTPWQNRVLVFIDRFVSDFGQNWLSPLLWMFSIHFVLFLCLSQTKLLCNWSICDIKCIFSAFFGGIGEYLTYLNPVHKFPDSYIMTNGDKIISFLMRISATFFIYHFIRATRRYGKV